MRTDINLLKKSSYDYRLPQELIAQTPADKRDQSRLLRLDRDTGEISHRRFYNIIDYLNPEDTLVINDTRVIPARIFGNPEGRQGQIETVLLKKSGIPKSGVGIIYDCLTRPGKKARPGQTIIYPGGLTGKVLEIISDGVRRIEFAYEGVFLEILEAIGSMPLPPYITRQLQNREQYQTIYATHNGSAAAPTAGLHFTPELLEQIRAKGIAIERILLHVGLGTFRPVKEDHITDHAMHSEFFRIDKDTAERINHRKRAGGRVIAVGTTCARALESVAKNGEITPFEGETDIFIYPGYTFGGIDGLITNFHLPESTLIMLVCAFAGYENTMKAYEQAVESRYRFFSFGDAMLIL